MASRPETGWTNHGHFFSRNAGEAADDEEDEAQAEHEALLVAALAAHRDGLPIVELSPPPSHESTPRSE